MDNNIVDVIKEILTRYGEDTFRNIGRVKNLLCDLAPRMTQERIQAKNFVEMNGYFILKYAGGAYPVVRRKLISTYSQTYCVDIDVAAWITDVFACVLGYMQSPSLGNFSKASDLYRAQIHKDKMHTLAQSERPQQHLAAIYTDPDAAVYEHGLMVDDSLGMGYGVLKTALPPVTPALRSVIAADFHTVAIGVDGKVRAVGPNRYGQCDCMLWEKVVSVTAGSNFTIGLKSDGTLLATGTNEHGQCNVLHYREIVSVSAGARHTVARTADGRVLAAGQNKYGECDVEGWRNIIAVKAGYRCTYAIKKDGTVLAKGNNANGELDVSHLTDVVSIAGASANGALALKRDGTVVKVNHATRGDFRKFTGLIDIAATPDCFIGLQADGNVVMLAYYWESSGVECNLDDWRNIAAIACGRYHVVGRTNDGELKAVMMHTDRRLDKGQCDVENWGSVM